MPDKVNCPPKHEREDGLFRRAEDWERLTRLEFIVQELTRENERVDHRIDSLVQKQDELQKTQDHMIRLALNIRMLLIGGLVTAFVFVTGLSKAIPMVIDAMIGGV